MYETGKFIVSVYNFVKSVKYDLGVHLLRIHLTFMTEYCETKRGIGNL